MFCTKCGTRLGENTKFCCSCGAAREIANIPQTKPAISSLNENQTKEPTFKALVCEMCGGNSLLKNEGVYICQNCNTQYTVEEAKKMMIEGAVDVTGSIVKVDNSAKFANLYKIARRARDDGNIAKAYRSYEELLMEDPDNWEPNFYSAFYEGLNELKGDEPGGSVIVSGGRVKLNIEYRSGLPLAISRIQNCLDSVFACIEEIVDYDEQIAAVDEVSLNVYYAAEIISSAVDAEHQRMRYEIDHFASETNDEGSIICKGFDKLTLGSTNNSKRDGYKRDIKDMLSLLDNKSTELEEIIGKRRFDEYWDDHKEQRAALEAEKNYLLEQVLAINNEVNATPQKTDGYYSMIELQKRAESLANEEKSLGIFKLKEKKAVQEEMNSVQEQITLIKSHIDSAVNSVKQYLIPVQNRIDEIDNELTRPR